MAPIDRLPALRLTTLVAALALALGGLVALTAQTSDDSPTKPAPCSSPEYRQFDFWVGEWDVHAAGAPEGRPPSRNVIRSVHGGCALLESYETPGGYTGNSLNYYDQGSKTWNQTWVDNGGGSLILRGELIDGAMVLRDDGSSGQINRITWTRRSDNDVRQLWETSSDGGKNWKIAFDGTYLRQGKR